MTQQRRTEKEIGDFTFEIPLLGVREQRRLLFKLAGVVGIPLAEMSLDESRESKGASVDVWESLRSAFKTLADDNVLKVYEYMIDLFLGDAKTTGTKITYKHESGEMATAWLKDVHGSIFDQRLDLEFKWIWACLQANFAGFLESMNSERASAFLQKVSGGSKSPKASTG